MEPASRASSRALPWLLFAIGYLSAWFVSTTVPTPLLWHLPLERRFTFEVRPLQLGADFLGRLLLSLAAGALCSLGRLALPGLLPQRWRPLLLRCLTLWATGLLLLTACLYLVLLLHRQPIPAPLPPGYVPR
jgi:hypothetical protein